MSYAISLPTVHLNKQQIVKLRRRLNWSQAAMARALGISNAMTISHWETGFREPTATALRLLCLLDSLSDTELRKISTRLEQIAQGEINARD